MGKKRSDRGAEGTGRRAGAPLSDSERSRAWEVDLVARCWLICHCAYVPGPGRPGLHLFFLCASCAFCAAMKSTAVDRPRGGRPPPFVRKLFFRSAARSAIFSEAEKMTFVRAGPPAPSVAKWCG